MLTTIFALNLTFAGLYQYLHRVKSKRVLFEKSKMPTGFTAFKAFKLENIEMEERGKQSNTLKNSATCNCGQIYN
jgi:hypothetical protein